ncbi:MAG: 2-amino-4-oxopentanoate thiolase subunit OrtA [Defluviitaleaceae bacterium]|nr:2-amino-4-oxopentanoate thiolase subunit OrtA [Defluviitaleaceae bacterium]
MIKKDAWVSICATILEAGSRADGIPSDTASMPLVMWVSGHLVEDCEIGGEATVRTVTGRIEHGILEQVEQYTNVDYGGYVPELHRISADARAILAGGAAHG